MSQEVRTALEPALDDRPDALEREAQGRDAPAVEETRTAVASQWTLMRLRFKKHRLAVICLWILGALYFIGIFGEFLAPGDPNETNERYKYLPPQGITFHDAEGNFTLRPGIHGLKETRDPETLRRFYTTDPSKFYPLSLFAHGDPYKMWGVIPSDIHLFGVNQEAGGDRPPIFILGADRLGRDMFSRLIYGARISLSIGLVSVILSLVFGITFGGVSGYYGGLADTAIQRVIEFIRSMPTIPLFLALAAAVPQGWDPLLVYFMITIILSLVGWTGLARVVRGRFLSLREEDFVMAARFSGASEARIIFRHMVPSFLSHIIASLTLAIPAVILSETTLSFLGLGLRPPIISWGVLLQEAQNVQTVALAPWLLIPGLAVVLTVMAYNFLGDGLRDAADPYAR